MSKLRKFIPDEGFKLALKEGNSLQRINLDLKQEGISLALVGSATANLSKSNRQVVELKPHAKGGIVLSVAGAANATL